MQISDPEKLRYVLITDRKVARRPLPEVVEAALRGGFTAVQLREKDLPASELYNLASALREITAAHDALLIVNDRIDVALAVEADAAHLGWRSLGIDAARKAAGDRLAFGVSAHNVVEMRQAIHDRADYVIFGPVFATPSKKGILDPVGVEKLKTMAVPAPMPVIGIGGIDKTNVADVLGSRAAGAAVIRAIMAADDPLRAAEEFTAAGTTPSNRFFPR